VDTDKCQDIAASQGISAMPTFNFYLNAVKVDMLRGANKIELENKVKRWAEASGATAGEESLVAGQIDLISLISKQNCECLNEADDAPLKRLLEGQGKALESDCDEQLIISIPFNQPIKLHSLVIQGPADSAPKTVKLFINLPNTLDFDQADFVEPAQVLELSMKQVESGEPINLRFVKFQNVQTLQMFVKDNLGGGEKTTISMLKFYGSPINATNMQEFKRVAGKSGEAH